MRFAGLFLAVLGVVLLATPCGCAPPPPLSLRITSPSPGATLRTNLVRVTGAVSDPHATVAVNGTETPVGADGEFSRYVDLVQGNNVVIITATLETGAVHKRIEIVFVPAVAVRLFPPDLDQFRGASGPTRVVVGGHVFPSRASVAVNGEAVRVADNGTFLASVLLDVSQGSNILKATATLDGAQDTWTYTVLLQGGVPTAAPGQGLAYVSHFNLPESVTVQAGGSVTLVLSADIGKDLSEIPSELAVNVVQSSGEYSRERAPFSDGLKVWAHTEKLSVYPNTAYPLEIEVTTQPNTPPGTYWLMVDTIMGNAISTSSWSKVQVTKPALPN